MPLISDEHLASFHRVAHDAAALAAAVQRDETGDMIAGQFVGNGNGGNMSRNTLLVKGNLQRSLNDLNNLSKEG